MDNLKLLLWNYFKFRYLYKFTSRDKLDKWKEKRIKEFLTATIPRSEFYRNYYKGQAIEDWRRFPKTDKQIMMENFDRLNTLGIKKEEAFQVAITAEKSRDFSPEVGNITVGLSSGTSGNRGVFLASPEERAIWAGAILAKTLPDGIIGNERIAFFLRANSNLYQTIDSRRIRFRFFDLITNIEAHVRELNIFQPTILVAPPLGLRMLAEAKDAGELKVNPQKVISVADVLETLDRDYIASRFGQVVHQIYQCTEGFLAVTCNHGTLHVNEDIVHIQKEYVDNASKRFVPVITDFTRTTQPIIRYRLNDILLEKSHCLCGSIFMAIDSIEGRADDVFYLRAKNGDGLNTVFPDFIRRAIIMTSAEIKDYKVDQVSLDSLEVYISVRQDCLKEGIRVSLLENFARMFETLNCSVPRITFMTEVRQDNTKKLRRVERKFKDSFLERASL